MTITTNTTPTYQDAYSTPETPDSGTRELANYLKGEINLSTGNNNVQNIYSAKISTELGSDGDLGKVSAFTWHHGNPDEDKSKTVIGIAYDTDHIGLKAVHVQKESGDQVKTNSVYKLSVKDKGSLPSVDGKWEAKTTFVRSRGENGDNNVIEGHASISTSNKEGTTGYLKAGGLYKENINKDKLTVRPYVEVGGEVPLYSNEDGLTVSTKGLIRGESQSGTDYQDSGYYIEGSVKANTPDNMEIEAYTRVNHLGELAKNGQPHETQIGGGIKATYKLTDDMTIGANAYIGDPIVNTLDFETKEKNQKKFNETGLRLNIGVKF